MAFKQDAGEQIKGSELNVFHVCCNALVSHLQLHYWTVSWPMPGYSQLATANKKQCWLSGTGHMHMVTLIPLLQAFITCQPGLLTSYSRLFQTVLSAAQAYSLAAQELSTSTPR